MSTDTSETLPAWAGSILTLLVLVGTACYMLDYAQRHLPQPPPPEVTWYCGHCGAENWYGYVLLRCTRCDAYPPHDIRNRGAE